ncbi:serine/threonine-protein phosphatase 2A regulatory subunit B'' subunit alpha-like [Tropilaelaps mercedesae]|uniref:Serine/threonine-protein phosphatase 2A regulatory subunit B'' subunit alpha-like n=1 Tax=Tropilaelaps mercedesae TaxID=418985 RepID=A0A1V9WY24_9ACAR|nr:serine/threonine-protein phosphatase 2A regulatory subunit B'' subunit alpha-like [Tropilaelaps mercedesae]
MQCGVVHKGSACAMADAGPGSGRVAAPGGSGGADLEKSLQRMLDPAALLEDDACLERLVHTFVAQDKISRGDDGKRGSLGCPSHRPSLSGGHVSVPGVPPVQANASETQVDIANNDQPLIKTGSNQKKVYPLRAPKQINLHFQSSYGQNS